MLWYDPDHTRRSEEYFYPESDDVTNSAEVEAKVAEITSQVEKLLRQGADVNASIEVDSTESIWFKYMGLRDDNQRQHGICAKVFDVMAPYIRGTTDQQPYLDLPAYVACFNQKNAHLASTILLAAIQETQGDIRIDFDTIFSGYGDAHDPFNSARVDKKNKMNSIFEIVHERLMNPQTDFERNAKDAILESNQNYWFNKIVTPPLDQLSLPSGAVNQGRKLNTPGMREEMRLRFLDAHESWQAIDALRNQGLASRHLKGVEPSPKPDPEPS